MSGLAPGRGGQLLSVYAVDTFNLAGTLTTEPIATPPGKDARIYKRPAPAQPWEMRKALVRNSQKAKHYPAGPPIRFAPSCLARWPYFVPA